MSAISSLLYGAANVLHPRMLWLMVWPMLVSLAVWGTVAIELWTRIAIWVLIWGSIAVFGWFVRDLVRMSREGR